jgi:hypothetical protein
MESLPATSRIQPGQLVSLWDMNEFFVSELYSFMETLSEAESSLARDADAEVSTNDRNRILQTTLAIWRHCQNAGLGAPSDSLTFLCGQLMRRVSDPEYENYGKSGAIYQDIKTFRQSLINALEPKCFLYMPASDAVYYDQKDLFGVKRKFPTANKELKAAGNCYATTNYTACVFHLMRAVEIGAKAMVAEMKAQKHIGICVPVKGVKTFKRKPVELCDWQTLIGGLRTALNKLEEGASTNTEKKRRHAYFSEAIAVFSHFKDAWRNPPIHGHDIARDRKLYFRGEATDIMNNTRHFMRHIAIHCKEAKPKRST